MSDTSLDIQASAERVADCLRDRIVKGECPPGSRLVERRLSAELNVSRTPIREALKLLRADGLVEISLHRGAQVLAYTAEEAENLFDLIAAIESLAAERLAGHIGAEVLARLETLHERMLKQYAAREASAYFDTNTEIHDSIVREAGNPVLIDSHRRIAVRARRGRFMAIFDAERWRQSVEEHEGVMAAFRARDTAAAARIWRQHLRHSGESVAETLRRQRG
ncbi:DNA-binding GntR family transcriptional regulator [Rhodovulum sulfidophilum]|uniref:GntR family transcriptional regulator n=1 Tax=Rhodovulum sulfidophilum TaxID=35806 RepID=UPI0005A665FB|nr:GntR family transcriptional regulator [Rhodovulum sulfidophilum]ANB33984.1 GntR family transcriptional regulator [Rhodovulum sulfidophilum DSM 1374]ANB37806.1 GntR family transcriptional regulator [Rhodovulum sulfidophilum]MCE8418477.1 GntR family transcriptional regulator [Rhodovulum sulfidophilum]MCW2304232.1 DNA-binding GntR family transcriptional regulator [Rhodovulum sulfidophilum]